MKLAQFIQTEMEQLLEDWEEAAVEILPELKGEERSVLKDHAREMLTFICKELHASQSDSEQRQKALGKSRFPSSVAAEGHGADRHDLGFSMLQMIQELRALRARVVKAWGQACQGLGTSDIDELIRFNEAIDQLIANSMESYSDVNEQQTRLLHAMLRVSPDPAAIFDTDSKLLFLNTPLADLADTRAQEAVGKTPLELALDPGFARDLHKAITTTISTGSFQRRELHCPLASGRELYFDCQFAPVFDDNNEVEAVAKFSRDVTERKQAEHEIWRSANYDALTGIPNRRLFLDRLEQSLREADRQARSFAVLFIDLDRFKQANDQLGHNAGDRLLRQVAERISTSVRSMDTVARLGGDEFTLIFKDVNREDAKKAAEGLLTGLERPFSVDAHQIHLSGSIGVALFPDDGEDAEQLLHNADQAMYAAKESGGHQVRLHHG